MNETYVYIVSPITLVYIFILGMLLGGVIILIFEEVFGNRTEDNDG